LIFGIKLKVIVVYNYIKLKENVWVSMCAMYPVHLSEIGLKTVK